jgi:chromosome segregation ATPase
MPEDRLKKLEEKLKEDFGILNERINSLEMALQDVYTKLQEIKQEKRFKEIEERINDLEDLQLLTRIELIKIKEYLRKTPLGGLSSTLEPKLEHLEAVVKNLEEKIEALSLGVHPSEAAEVTTTQEVFGEDMLKLQHEVEDLKKEVENLKGKMEEFEKTFHENMFRLGKLLKKLVERI